MARVESSVEIAAPRQAVWDLLADPSRHTEFGTFVDEVKLVTEGEVREGTVYELTPRFSSLEDVYTQMTHASVEYRATAPERGVNP